ncbi:cx9C motif-containing protein 4 isoform X1 [Malaclemys terrapin pileata]|uniref:cx9C motif-containing protein 4 isoform X1 n=1 Tax=Malaclemys terrapin pileata TaxID=2991368 RepID=UPI0023A8F629|nr:cx9C motif-containing protein 4 isoform X1 [Malaclemys terrapin pileata]
MFELRHFGSGASNPPLWAAESRVRGRGQCALALGLRTARGPGDYYKLKEYFELICRHRQKRSSSIVLIIGFVFYAKRVVMRHWLRCQHRVRNYWNPSANGISVEIEYHVGTASLENTTVENWAKHNASVAPHMVIRSVPIRLERKYINHPGKC